MPVLKITIALLALAVPCLAQQSLPDPATYMPGSNAEATRLEKAWLSSGNPRDVAWASELIAQEGRREMAPDLIAQLDSRATAYQNQPALFAVLDALIQLGARVPSGPLANLPSWCFAHKVILLARTPDNREPLMTIFRAESNALVWLAAADLLAEDPHLDFARLLLADLHVEVNVAVVVPGISGGIGGGCGGSYGHGVEGSGWPQMNSYGLSLTKGTIFAGGVHPVRYYTFDYNTGHPDFNCSSATKGDFIPGLLSQVARISASELRLATHVQQAITYRGIDSYLANVLALLSPLNEDFQRLLRAYERLGYLSPVEAQTIRLPVDLTIEDRRFMSSPPLPPLPEFDFLEVRMRSK